MCVNLLHRRAGNCSKLKARFDQLSQLVAFVGLENGVVLLRPDRSEELQIILVPALFLAYELKNRERAPFVNKSGNLRLKCLNQVSILDLACEWIL